MPRRSGTANDYSASSRVTAFAANLGLPALESAANAAPLVLSETRVGHSTYRSRERRVTGLALCALENHSARSGKSRAAHWRDARPLLFQRKVIKHQLSRGLGAELIAQADRGPRFAAAEHYLHVGTSAAGSSRRIIR